MMMMMMVATRGTAETTRTSTSIITVLNTIMTMTMTIIIIVVVIATIDDRVSVVIWEEGITIAMTITLQVRLGLESIGVFHFTYGAVFIIK